MSEPTSVPSRRRGRRIIESLPASAEVREEFRRTSRQLRLLVELLGLCEKAEGLNEHRRAGGTGDAKEGTGR